MNLLIRKGEKKDVNQVFSLIEELADFEKSIHEVSITPRCDHYHLSTCYRVGMP